MIASLVLLAIQRGRFRKSDNAFREIEMGLSEIKINRKPIILKSVNSMGNVAEYLEKCKVLEMNLID